MCAAGPSSSVEPIRQGFVGYVNVGGVQWRVMLRLRLEGDAWWRGRLWYSEDGGTEVWDKEELVARSPEDLLRDARSLASEELIRRFSHSYDERRRYFALRALLDELLEKGRALNRVSVRAAAGEVSAERAQAELDRIQLEMKGLVEGMRQVAAQEARLVG
jgi:hypothetical protein